VRSRGTLIAGSEQRAVQRGVVLPFCSHAQGGGRDVGVWDMATLRRDSGNRPGRNPDPGSCNSSNGSCARGETSSSSLLMGGWSALLTSVCCGTGRHHARPSRRRTRGCECQCLSGERSRRFGRVRFVISTGLDDRAFIDHNRAGEFDWWDGVRRASSCEIAGSRLECRPVSGGHRRCVHKSDCATSAAQTDNADRLPGNGRGRPHDRRVSAGHSRRHSGEPEPAQ
jgi:hypothetical protein